MAYSVVFVADALGLGDKLGPIECLGVLCLTMIGLALPAPPGQIGVFEGSLVAALDRASLAEGRAVTVPLARQVLEGYETPRD